MGKTCLYLKKEETQILVYHYFIYDIHKLYMLVSHVYTRTKNNTPKKVFVDPGRFRELASLLLSLLRG